MKGWVRLVGYVWRKYLGLTNFPGGHGFGPSPAGGDSR